MILEDTIEHMDTADEINRPLWPAIGFGLLSKCPACTKGELFEGFLTSNDHCPKCKEDLSHQRADDFPAYLNIFIVGHVVLTLMLIAMKFDFFGMWTLMGLSIGLAVVMSIVLMRPLRGAVIGAQWAMRMHGFSGNDD